MVSHHLSGNLPLDRPLRSYSSICLGSLEHYTRFIYCSQILLYCCWYSAVGATLNSFVISFINAYQLKMNNSQKDAWARTGILPKRNALAEIRERWTETWAEDVTTGRWTVGRSTQHELAWHSQGTSDLRDWATPTHRTAHFATPMRGATALLCRWDIGTILKTNKTISFVHIKQKVCLYSLSLT